jgi:hypothetical protein
VRKKLGVREALAGIHALPLPALMTLGVSSSLLDIVLFIKGK